MYSYTKTVYVEPCRDCEDGYVEVAQDGFKYPDRICEVCNGSGEIEHDENSLIGGDYCYVCGEHILRAVQS